MAAMSVSAMCTTAVGADVAARRTSNISSAKFGCNTSAFAARVSGSKGAGERGSLVIRMAATKQKKNRDLNMLKGMLENEETLLVAGFRYQGLSVKNMIKFRRDLPEGAHLLITKNTLMVKATEGTKWESISECATGMNAWLFVDENIAPAIKSVKSLQKDWMKSGIDVEFTGAVLDGKFIDAKGIGALEKLPTKKDLITMVAVGIKQVPTKLARATNGVPTKLAYGVKAIADGESDLINA